MRVSSPTAAAMCSGVRPHTLRRHVGAFVKQQLGDVVVLRRPRREKQRRPPEIVSGVGGRTAPQAAENAAHVVILDRLK